MYAYLVQISSGHIANLIPDVQEVSDNKIVAREVEIEGINHEVVYVFVSNKLFEVGKPIPTDEPNLIKSVFRQSQEDRILELEARAEAAEINLLALVDKLQKVENKL